MPAGVWQLIGSLCAVPRRLIWDNEIGIGRRNSYAAGVAAFAGVLATRIVQVKPYDPESKGVVERTNQFLETSILPGRVYVRSSPTPLDKSPRRFSGLLIDTHEPDRGTSNPNPPRWSQLPVATAVVPDRANRS